MSRQKEDIEAKRQLIREWDIWAKENIPSDRKANGDDGLIFFGHLKKNRADLLDFRTKGQNQWQIIHGWLLRESRVAD